MASNRLYPPLIEGTIPAFYLRYKNDNPSSAVVTVPFSMNRATSISEIGGMRLRFKYILKNEAIGSVNTTTIDYTKGEAVFTIKSSDENSLTPLFKIGLFYKVQVAFLDINENEGYYSTVGVIKCVAKPKVTIDGYSTGSANAFNNEIIGVYELDMTHAEGDNTEKVYSYRFDMWDSNDKLVVTTGNLIHNTSEDTEYDKSRDVFYTNKYLREGEIGHIQYTVKTLNGLIVSSPKYRIIRVPSIDMVYPLEVFPELNFEEGYIKLLLGFDAQKIAAGKKKRRCTGLYVITRGSAQDDYFEWNEIARFNMNNQWPQDFSFNDYTIELGITYKYALLQYNSYGVYSNRKITKEIYADFEDMFIFDGTRQLKVKFNPKVSSFKANIQEQKTDTIGSKFPYFFRNGKVNYKEFPIAGLLSYWEDLALLFLQDDEPWKADLMREDVHRGTSVSLHWDSGISHPYFDTDETSWRHTTTHENLLGIMYLPGEKLYNLYLLYDADNPDLALIEVINKLLLSAKKDGIITDDLLLPDDNTVILDNIDNIREMWQYATGIDLSNVDYVRYNTERPEIRYKDEKDTLRRYKPEHKEATYSVKRITDLLSDNIMSERYFKLKVLEWLNNGKPKLFRSPGEGNYIVRLMNSSLTPIDSLGRMLHNFQCTAYEMADYTYDNLIKFGIVKIVDLPNEALLFESVLCKQIGDNSLKTAIIDKKVQFFHCEDFEPGDIVYINLVNPDKVERFVIGSTGALVYNFESRTIHSVSVQQISKPGIVNGTPFYGETLPFYSTDFHRVIHYGFIGPVKTKFDEIKRIRSYTLVDKQYIGKRDYSTYYNIINGQFIESVINQSNTNSFLPLGLNTWLTKNIDDGGFGYKLRLLNLELIKILHRSPMPIYMVEDLPFISSVNHYSEKNKYFIDLEDYNTGYDTYEHANDVMKYHLTLEAGAITDDGYVIKTQGKGQRYDPISQNPATELTTTKPYEIYTTSAFVDGNDDTGFNIEQSKCWIGNDNLSTAGTFINIDDTLLMKNLGNISKVIIAAQLITHFTCQLQVIDYTFEDEITQACNDKIIDDKTYETNWHKYIKQARKLYNTKIERVYGIE